MTQSFNKITKQCRYSKPKKWFSIVEREPKVQTQSKNPVYRQPEVSFKQLTDSNQSSVDDMAVIRGQG